MKKGMYAALATAIMLTISGGVSQASDYQLDTVYVEGERNPADLMAGGFTAKTGRVGILGAQDVMKTPFDQTNYTEKTINTFNNPTSNFVSVLQNNPSVRSASIVTHGHFYVHGVYTHGSYANVNGVPNLLGQFSTPTFFADQIELNTSPNMGLNGSRASYAMGNQKSSSPALINLHTKRGTLNPLTRYTQTFAGKGMFTEELDFGRRFGENKEWGVRINVLNTNGEIALKDVHRKEQGYSINIDHQAERSSTNLFAGYYYLNLDGGHRWFGLGNGVTKLPSVPDHNTNYDFDGQYKWEKTWMAAFNHEQRLNDHVTAFFNMGTSYHKFDWRIFGYGGGWTIKDDEGNFDTTTHQDFQDWRTYFAQAGLRDEITNGKLRHQLSFAMDKSWFNSYSSKNDGVFTIGGNGGVNNGNLYNGLIDKEMHISNIMGAKVANESEYLTSYSFNDYIQYNKWGILVGALHQNATLINRKNGQVIKDSAWSPTFGITYNPNENVEIYANHTEGFARPTLASGKNLINNGDVLPASKIKQNELGLKVRNGDSFYSLSAFQIKEGQISTIRVRENPEPTDIQISNGQREYKGVSFSYSGKIASKWNAMGGFEYVHSDQKNTAGHLMEGKPAPGVPYWNGVLALEYMPNDQWSITGRAVYTGSSKIYSNSNTREFTVPSYTVFDFGASYKTKWNDVPVTVSAMCFNVFDKNYWYTNKNGLLLSMPRTYTLSLSLDF